jgi:hypothetical protein
MIRSGVTPPNGHRTQGQKVKQGLFVVNNAYDGTYSFFATRPLPTARQVKADRKKVEARG